MSSEYNHKSPLRKSSASVNIKNILSIPKLDDPFTSIEEDNLIATTTKMNSLPRPKPLPMSVNMKIGEELTEIKNTLNDLKFRSKNNNQVLVSLNDNLNKFNNHFQHNDYEGNLDMTKITVHHSGGSSSSSGLGSGSGSGSGSVSMSRESSCSYESAIGSTHDNDLFNKLNGLETGLKTVIDKLSVLGLESKTSLVKLHQLVEDNDCNSGDISMYKNDKNDNSDLENDVQQIKQNLSNVINQLNIIKSSSLSNDHILNLFEKSKLNNNGNGNDNIQLNELINSIEELKKQMKDKEETTNEYIVIKDYLENKLDSIENNINNLKQDEINNLKQILVEKDSELEKIKTNNNDQLEKFKLQFKLQFKIELEELKKENNELKNQINLENDLSSIKQKIKIQLMNFKSIKKQYQHLIISKENLINELGYLRELEKVKLKEQIELAIENNYNNYYNKNGNSMMTIGKDELMSEMIKGIGITDFEELIDESDKENKYVNGRGELIGVGKRNITSRI